MFARLRGADNKEDFKNSCDDLVRSYLDTSSVRGGALIVVQATLPKYSDDPYIFVLKCDFEQKTARISDERSLTSQVEMAISTRNMKSIQAKWESEQVAEAAERIVEIKPEIELKFRIGDTLVKGRLAEIGDQILLHS